MSEPIIFPKTKEDIIQWLETQKEENLIGDYKFTSYDGMVVIECNLLPKSVPNEVIVKEKINR